MAFFFFCLAGHIQHSHRACGAVRVSRGLREAGAGDHPHHLGLHSDTVRVLEHPSSQEAAGAMQSSLPWLTRLSCTPGACSYVCPTTRTLLSSLTSLYNHTQPESKSSCSCNSVQQQKLKYTIILFTFLHHQKWGCMLFGGDCMINDNISTAGWSTSCAGRAPGALSLVLWPSSCLTARITVFAGIFPGVLQVSLEHCGLPVHCPAVCLCHCLVGLCSARCPALRHQPQVRVSAHPMRCLLGLPSALLLDRPFINLHIQLSLLDPQDKHKK